ncbi:type II secretion system protein N [Parahaliea mediterranea]|uniref:Type II secretion system protein N n=1 Tax=Parahaliea mediterranea TaxID=651086 RepID=A0A939IKY8_9GAMM|nr:type II secretion system protein N [Parahaliea mediterranea]
MRRWMTFGALLLVFLLALAAAAPARLLPALLPPGQLQMQGLSGSIWHGTASRCLLNTPAGYLQLGRVEWRLRPLSLLWLAPSVDFDSQWGEQHISARATLHGAGDLGLRDVDARIDASLLRQLAPVAVDGRFALMASRLRLRDGLPAGAEGRLVWEHGSWATPQMRLPLGSYAVEFEQPGAGDALVGEVLTLDGPVRAAGSVRLDGLDYVVDVRIGGEHGLDPALARALSLMARPEGEAFRLRLSGALPAP